MNKEFDLKNTLRAIDMYVVKCFFETKDTEYKPFYDVFKGEMGFFKFHIQALWYRDWPSIKTWWKDKYYK